METIQILICGHYPKFYKYAGGPTIHCGKLSELLVKKNNVILLIPGKNSRQLVEKGINIIIMGGSPTKRLSLKYLKYAWNLKKKYDVIHFMHLTNSFVYQYLNFFIKKPHVVTVHGYSSLENIVNSKSKMSSFHFKIKRWIEKKAVKRADAIIAVGKTQKKWIIDELAANPEKVFYIPNGVDVNDFKFKSSARNELRRKFKIDKETKIILYSKGLSKQNGIMNVLEAMGEIIKKHPDTMLFVLGEGPLKKEVLEYQSNHFPKNIIYGGLVPHKEVVNYMSFADIFILPSNVLKFNKTEVGEVCPLSIREAMACQLGVVATKVGGNKEILEDGKNIMKNDVGLLILPNNSEDISKAIVQLLDNPKKIKEMGQFARKFVENNCTWEIMVEKVSDIYKYAIENYNKENQ